MPVFELPDDLTKFVKITDFHNGSYNNPSFFNMGYYSAEKYVEGVHECVFAKCLSRYLQYNSEAEKLFKNFDKFHKFFFNLVNKGMVPMIFLKSLTEDNYGDTLFWGFLPRKKVRFDELLTLFLYGSYDGYAVKRLPSIHMMVLYSVLVKLLVFHEKDIKKTKFIRKFVRFLVTTCNVDDKDNVLTGADAGDVDDADAGDGDSDGDSDGDGDGDGDRDDVDCAD